MVVVPSDELFPGFRAVVTWAYKNNTWAGALRTQSHWCSRTNTAQVHSEPLKIVRSETPHRCAQRHSGRTETLHTIRCTRSHFVIPAQVGLEPLFGLCPSAPLSILPRARSHLGPGPCLFRSVLITNVVCAFVIKFVLWCKLS